MSETTGTPRGEDPGATGTEVVHEAYAFACMRCSHLWEQSFEIEHRVDAEGHTTVAYTADGRHVPSPLTQPTCSRCGGHLIRILQAGMVDNPALHWSAANRTARPADSAAKRAGHLWDAAGPAPDDTADHDGEPKEGGHHWHLWHLPAFLHLHRKSDPAA